MHVHDLEPLFTNEELSKLSEEDQIKAFYKIYIEDFVSNTLVINGKNIRIRPVHSKIPELKAYHETFAHLITREYKSQFNRFYEVNRANRIHWIKPILLSSSCNELKYFKYRDERNICKEYFWHFHKDFMVVLKPICADLQIVTAFCVDEEEKLKFYEWFKAYQGGKILC